MKRTILAISLVFFVCISAFAHKSKNVVWDYPNIGYTAYPGFMINKVEFGKDRTSVFMSRAYPSDSWFLFSPNTYIEVDGKRYTIIGSDSIELGKQIFTDPQTWKKDFVLHFQPLPKKVKEFDLLEGTNKGDFAFYSIHPLDTKLPEPKIPKDFLSDYPEEDVESEMVFSDEPSTIHFKTLNYKKGMGGELRITYFDLEKAEWAHKAVRFDDEGCADFTCNLYYPMRVQVNMDTPFNPIAQNYGSVTSLYLAPGKEVTALINMIKVPDSISDNFIGYKGYMAKTEDFTKKHSVSHILKKIIIIIGQNTRKKISGRQRTWMNLSQFTKHM